MNDKPKLVIKAGKRYKLRNGLITEVIHNNKGIGGAYIWGAWVQEDCYPDKSHMNWLESGKALVPFIDHKHDIVEEIVE